MANDQNSSTQHESQHAYMSSPVPKIMDWGGDSRYPQAAPFVPISGAKSSGSISDQETGRLSTPPPVSSQFDQRDGRISSPPPPNPNGGQPQGQLAPLPQFASPTPFSPPLSSQRPELGQLRSQIASSPIFISPPQNSSSQSSGRKKSPVMIIVSTICIVALLSTIVFFVYHHMAQAIPGVTLYHVGIQNVNQDIGGGGILYPNQRLDISVPFTSHVTAVLVKPGDQVTPNQTLMRLDMSTLNNEIAEASSDVAAAQTYLASVSGLGLPVYIARAQQMVNVAEARYNALLAEASSPTMHNGTLVSSIKGVVTTINIYPGEVFAANKVLLSILDESIAIVHAQVPLSNFEQVHLNQAAIVSPSALPNQNFNGSVTSIIPSSNAQTDTFQVWINVANPKGVLLPGMSAFVRIQNPIRALVVPRLAVLNPDREAAVFVVQNQQAHLRHVQIAGYAGDSVIIGSGLSTGDMIVLVGLNSVQDGQEVQVTNTEGSSSGSNGG